MEPVFSSYETVAEGQREAVLLLHAELTHFMYEPKLIQVIFFNAVFIAS